MRFVTDNRVIDRGPNKRTMQVIAAGLPRCATSSIQKALESDKLGFFPSMHMAHVIPHVDRCQLVLKALAERDRAKRHELLYELFDGCAATCDFPGVLFTDDLMDMYPTAKIILNQRDTAEQWADSILASIAPMETWYHRALTCLFVRDRMHKAMVSQAWRYWDRNFMIGSAGDRAAVVKLYDRYNAWVREQARKRGREVLEFKPGDGMAPLCEFLEVKEVLDEPLPFTNDRRQMEMLRRYLLVRGILAWSGIFAGAYFLLKYLPWALRMMKGLI